LEQFQDSIKIEKKGEAMGLIVHQEILSHGRTANEEARLKGLWIGFGRRKSFIKENTTLSFRGDHDQYSMIASPIFLLLTKSSIKDNKEEGNLVLG